MKKKDYELIGNEIKIVFKKSNGNEYVRELACNLSESLKLTSPTFDKKRFLENCGIKEEN